MLWWVGDYLDKYISAATCSLKQKFLVPPLNKQGFKIKC